MLREWEFNNMRFGRLHLVVLRMELGLGSVTYTKRNELMRGSINNVVTTSCDYVYHTLDYIAVQPDGHRTLDQLFKRIIGD